jgi:glycosyltransferase involved in cell wall biosynthesis
MAAPEVSVVMSVYNNADDLDLSVNSILSQEGVDFEFIVIDDGSSDGSSAMLDAFAARDARMRVIHQENMGLTRALIRGCNEARGQFIARHDADDISLPGRLMIQAQMLHEHANLAFVSSWADWIGPVGEMLFEEKTGGDHESLTRLLLYEKQGPAAHGSVMFRKSAYTVCGGYRKAFYYAQDVDLWLRMGHVGQLGYVQKSLYRYKVSLESISGSSGDLQSKFSRLAHECHEARLKGADETELLGKAEKLCMDRSGKSCVNSTQAMAYFIGRCLLSNADKRAASYFWLVIRKRPWHLLAWLSLLQITLWPFKQLSR